MPQERCVWPVLPMTLMRHAQSLADNSSKVFISSLPILPHVLTAENQPPLVSIVTCR